MRTDSECSYTHTISGTRKRALTRTITIAHAFTHTYMHPCKYTSMQQRMKRLILLVPHARSVNPMMSLHLPAGLAFEAAQLPPVAWEAAHSPPVAWSKPPFHTQGLSLVACVPQQSEVPHFLRGTRAAGTCNQRTWVIPLVST